MLELVRLHPRYGYRFITEKLRQEGWSVNAKRIYRLWRREGLKVPEKKRKRRRLGASDNACHRRRAEHKNDVWCWDFIFDRTENGTALKWLSIIDEFTRECLCLKVDRGITSEDVIDTLAELFAMRGVPNHIRSDNGPEFVAHAIGQWLARVGVHTLYIEPGAPWQNGYAGYHPVSSVKVPECLEAASLGFEGHVTFSGFPFFADFHQHGGHQS
jgi:transposase InsO family protein